MANDYFELLKHPEWQKKRLRIMERDGFQCRECGDKETTLNVHHSYYTKGAKPWEYPDESLHTLCETCHELVSELHTNLKRAFGCLRTTFAHQALGYVTALLMQQKAIGGDYTFRFQLSDDEVLSCCQATGVAHAYSDASPDYVLTADEVIMYTGTEGFGQNDVESFLRESAEAAALRWVVNTSEPPRAHSSAGNESGRSLCGDCRA